MINNEILEGIKHSLLRGESIDLAASTFKNAGYLESEVDEAVRVLKTNSNFSQSSQNIQSGENIPSTDIPIKKPTIFSPQKLPTDISSSSKNPSQIISSYEQSPKKSIFESGWFITVLIILLFILFGLLVSLFFFRDSITDFLNNLLVQ